MAPSEQIAGPDGTPIAVERLHGEGPTIVLLHAGVADLRSWRDVAGLLNGRGAEVVAYDRRGFGATAPADGPFDHLDDLRAVLDSVAPGEPAWLVGSSQGGLISLDLAMTSPERVAGLVLIAPAVSGAPEIGNDDLDPATREIAEELDAAEAASDLDRVNELEAHLWLDGPDSPEGRVTGAVRNLALGMNAIALASGQSDHERDGDRDAWSRLEEIEVPATIIWGELDIPAVIETCRELARRLPDCAEPIVLEQTAHLPGLERPQPMAAVIAEAVWHSPKA
jgi:pimeloyl-ACP methyl ester carboxylesterase